MAGIYIHIPFCKSICNYCDFYRVASSKYLQQYIFCITKELVLRRNFLEEEINTIYFGGGTPSLLSTENIQNIISSIKFHFSCSNTLEITLEANPDDLSNDYLNELVKTDINRLSIGIQSFNNSFLKIMNRRHSAEIAINAIKNAQNYGFSNISADIIFGLPNQTIEDLNYDLQQMLMLHIQHISAYSLTYETNTIFSKWKDKQKIIPITDSLVAEMFYFVHNTLTNNDFEHYETSNFAKNGKYSIHNSNYWNRTKYVGIGAAAHSYNGKSRFWNVSNIKQYCEKIMLDIIPQEEEILSFKDEMNETILTGLRTSRGVNLIEFEKLFGNKYLKTLLSNSSSFIENKNLVLNNNFLKITEKGLIITDYITSELFFL